MTRKEEIRKAAMAFISIFPFTGSRSVAFCRGAQWADEHPKNPWREGCLPTENGEYLVECGYYKCGELHAFHKTLYWKHDEWINECLGDFVLRWMPIPSINDYK